MTAPDAAQRYRLALQRLLDEQARPTPVPARKQAALLLARVARVVCAGLSAVGSLGQVRAWAAVRSMVLH